MMGPPPLDTASHALFLDFDGTLVSFADDPQAVAIEPDALQRLLVLAAALNGALAIVSGRPIADLDRFLAPLAFCAAGVHGLERRTSPKAAVERLAGPEVLDDLRRTLSRAVASSPGLHLEDKGSALVVHYRTAPEREADAKAIVAESVSGRSDLAVMHGNCIVEVHPAGMDKGQAVIDLMSRAPFVGRQPVYVGDDTTDEFAFQRLATVGGIGIKVGEGTTAADYRLADVAAVHGWLAGGARIAASLDPHPINA